MLRPLRKAIRELETPTDTGELAFISLTLIDD